MERGQGIALVCIALLTVAALVPATLPVIESGLSSNDAAPAGHEPELAKVDEREPGATPLARTSHLAPLLSTLLGEQTAQHLDGTPKTLFEHLDHAPAPASTNAVTLLQAARDRWDPAGTAYPPVPESASLGDALDRYARTLGQGPLGPLETHRVTALPTPLSGTLTPLVDAFTYATTLQQEALADLSIEQRRDLLSLAGQLSDPTTSAADPAQVERFQALSQRVDLGKLTHGATVLTQATLDARDRLRADLAAGVLGPDNLTAVLDQPTGVDLSTTSHKLRLAEEILRGRAQIDQPVTAGAETSADLQAALTRLTRALVGQPDLPAPDLPAQAQQLPADLRAALAALVTAKARALESPSTASAVHAAGTLRALAEVAPTLQRWSHLLEMTPPATHFLSPDQLEQQTLGVALEAPRQARSAQGLLALAGHQGGHPLPAQADHQDPPPLAELVPAWYRALDLQPPASGTGPTVQALGELPQPVQEATALLMDAQIHAADLLAGTQLTPEDQRTLARTAPAVNALLGGAPATPDRIQALERFDAVASPSTTKALEAGLLLARSADAAHLALLPLAGTQDHETTELDPGELPEPEAPDSEPPPIAQAPASAPDTPFSQPGKDVWFQDEDGLIRITGYEGSDHPAGFHAISIDLGGDDTRQDNAGGVTDTSPAPFAISLDMGGDDTYTSQDPHVQGAAAIRTGANAFPVGILYDYRGDDTYRAGPMSQGAAYLGGLGLLLDTGGDDSYSTEGPLADPPGELAIGGGQGYAVHAPALRETPAPPSLGLLADLEGQDTYRSQNGQGSAVALSPEEEPTTGVRSATGLLFDGLGDDEYACQGICLGQGRFGLPDELDCERDEGACSRALDPSTLLQDPQAALGSAGTTAPEPRPGNAVATGTFLDLSGTDTYPRERGANNKLHPAAASLATLPSADGTDTVQIQAGVRVNVTVFVDLGLADANGDGVPDQGADWLGYDPYDPDEGPLQEPLEALDPVGLVAGPDQDGDGYSDALEERLGTDPESKRSAPAHLPPFSNTRSDKLLDLSLDITTGTLLTGEREAAVTVGTWEQQVAEGIGSDGTTIGLLAIGDTTNTRWEKDYLLALDVGGDDGYRNHAGAAFLPFPDQAPVENLPWPVLPSLLVDLGGDDAYNAPDRLPSQGTGVTQAYGLLVDENGDDRYRAEAAAQAAALGPNAVGLLLDISGDDTYTADQAAQGYTAPTCQELQRYARQAPCNGNQASASLLLDYVGDDVYQGPGQAQLAPRSVTQIPFPTYTSNTVFSPADDAYPGAVQSPPTDQGWPYPYGAAQVPVGDTATVLDLFGEDTYQVPGPRDPFTTQGHVTETVPLGHSLALFGDTGGEDRYLQLLQNGGQRLERFRMNDRVHVTGLPYTDTGDQALTGFFDVSTAAFGDGLYSNDLVRSLTGSRPDPSQEDQNATVATGNEHADFVLNLPRLGVVVGGTFDNVYNRTVPLLVDLGGDDVYNAPVGAARGDAYDPTRTPLGVGLALDVGGDDTFQHTVTDPGLNTDRLLYAGGYGSGVLGIGVLSASGGNDTYSTTLHGAWESGAPTMGLTQGAALQGVGVLLTDQSNSTFRLELTTDAPVKDLPPSLGMAQGAAFLGVGVLATQDPRGQDTYEIHVEPATHPRAAGQGYAVEGLGALLEAGGEDRFYATGLAQGTATTLAAPSWGFTEQAPPVPTRENRLMEPRDWGIGVLAAYGEGNATYQLTHLGQGAAWGTDRWGLLLDAAGHDTYTAGSVDDGTLPALAQGIGFPAGTGLLLDHQGDDTYTAIGNETGTSAAQGVAWPLLGLAAYSPEGRDASFTGTGHALGLLADLNGHDTYEAQDGAQGASTLLGGAGVLFEARGDDRFRANSRAQGYGETTLGLFVDAGGADRYGMDHVGLSVPLVGPLTPCDGTACNATGPGNDIVWSVGPNPADLASGGLGIDAPVAAIAQNVLGQARATTGLDAPRIEIRLLRAAGPQGPCTDQEITGSAKQDLNGIVCLEATVRGLDQLEGEYTVERVRFNQLHQEVSPTLIEELAGSGTRYTHLWDTGRPAFTDGTTHVRVRAELSRTHDGAHRADWATRSMLELQDETQITLDNPPVAVIDAPRWHNPDLGWLNLTVHVLGEAPATDAGGQPVPVADLTDVHLVPAGTTTPCATVTSPRSTVTFQQGLDGFQVSFPDLTACPSDTHHVVQLDGTDRDGTLQPMNHTDPANRSRIGVDRTGPPVTLDGPRYVDREQGSTGGFLLSWNATDDFAPAASVLLQVQRDGAWTDWLIDQPVDGQATWESFTDGESLRFRAVARDAAGTAGPAASHGVSVDLTPPRISHPRVSPQYVQSGEPVAFMVNASEPVGGCGAQVEIDGELHCMSSRSGPGEDTVYVYDNWDRETEDLAEEEGARNISRPEGYAYRFLVADRAGNTATTLEQQVFLDDIPPDIGNVTLAYPNGQAAGPGDLVRIQVEASDALALADQALADVSNVSSTGEGLHEDGLLRLRLDPATGNHTGLFLVDRAPDPGNATVHLVVPDRAGNTNATTVPVEIVTQAPTAKDVHATATTATTATLAWTTDLPATTEVSLTDPLRGARHTTQTSKLATDHSLTLDGLDPSTSYMGTLVPINAAGGTGSPVSFTLTTQSAIDLQLTQPHPGTLASGTLTAAWNATDPTGEPLTLSIRAVKTDPLDPADVPLADLTVPNADPGTRTLDLTGAPDGHYVLQVTARNGHDRTTRTIQDLTVDNTAPTTRLLHPRPGAVLAPGNLTLQAAAVDALSGTDPAAVYFTLDGATYPATQAEDGTFTATAPAPAAEASQISITAEDHAGNLARDQGPIFLDPTAPEGLSLQLELPGDQTQAKPGDLVAVRLTTDQPEPGLTATLRPGPLTGANATDLHRGAQGFTGQLTLPAALSDGTHDLRVNVVDAAGNARDLVAELGVDTQPPTVRNLTVVSTGHTQATVELCTSEPTRATLQLHDATRGSTLGHAGDSPEACHLVVVPGLRPGTTYTLDARARDAAGHIAQANATLTTEPDTTRPGTAHALTTGSPTHSAVTLAWQPATDDVGLEGYRVLRADASGPLQAIARTANTTYVDHQARPGTTYRYAIQAVDLAGNLGPETNPLLARPHVAPGLHGGQVSPAMGDADTLFTFTVNYTGPLPAQGEVQVLLDGTPHPMKLTGDPEHCQLGCTLVHRTRLAPQTLDDGGHTYAFQASVEGLTSQLPAHGRPEIGPVVVEQGAQDDLPTGAAVALGGLGGLLSLAGALAALRRFGGG